MIIILFWDLQHTQETHPWGTSVFSPPRLIFDIFPLPFTETSVRSDVDYVLCLDSIGKTDDLFLLVSKPPKEGTLAFSLVEVCTVCCRYKLSIFRWNEYLILNALLYNYKRLSLTRHERNLVLPWENTSPTLCPHFACDGCSNTNILYSKIAWLIEAGRGKHKVIIVVVVSSS